mmetsp:Transcript_43833/g.80048  ORF Transcript_43833/g.80048 Transcript_43833/m.80048 type:complete len:272 (+) Transcript_43833:67-882(+)
MPPKGGFYAGKGGGKGGSTGGDGVAAVPQSGPPLPKALLRKLETLGYPELQTVALSGQDYCKVVLWLEEEKIRYYEKHDRRVLRDFNKAWYSHVEDYCKELGIFAEDFSDKNTALKLQVLNSLTNLAVHDIYRDKVEANELTIVAPAATAGSEEKRKLEELVPPLNALLQAFGLPKLPENVGDSDTLAALKCIHTRVCPPASFNGPALDLDKLPVGLDISDPVVRRAAAVLRVLHGIELQQLQVNINHVINELQQLTADPKTDARLGRVGR